MDRSGWSMVWLIPARMFYIDNNRVSDVDQWCDVPMSFKLSKKRGMWCLKRILSLTGREVMRERETVHVILDKMRERDERGMRDERERDRSRQFWSQSWLGQGEMKCLFFFVEKRERERVCVCVCVFVCVYVCVIWGLTCYDLFWTFIFDFFFLIFDYFLIYLIFFFSFSLFALEHEEAYEWRGIWLRVRWCDTIISELIDMV